MGGARGLHHGFVFGRILVGLEENFVKLVAHRRRAPALAQLNHPLLDLQGNLFFLFNRCQGQSNDLGRGFAKTPFAGAAKVVRCLEQSQQRGGLLHQRGVGAEILACQFRKTKFTFGRKLPGQLQLNCLAQHQRCGEQLRGRWLFEFEQDGGGLDLDPFAAVKLYLRRRLCLRQHPTGHKLSGFFKE